MSAFEQGTLAEWLRVNLPELGPLTSVAKFTEGQSNPTYMLECANARAVLRRQPFGELLPSAHAVDREFRLLSAIHPSGFPVPRPLAMCEDKSVIGVMFYVMELVEGRTFSDGLLPDLEQGNRKPLYRSATEALVALHTLNHEALGLSNFGAPGNYFERQVQRWTRQYRSSQTDDIPEVEWLIEWLPTTIPEQTRTAIIHGDFRIDNLIFAPSGPDVAAVLDWELATIGDPMADFAYFAMHWILPYEAGKAGLSGCDLDSLGVPSLEDICAIYCAGTGRSSLPDLHWYFAYNLFRLVGIAQGIKKRVATGNASSAEADRAIAKIVPLARLAWAEARRAGAPEKAIDPETDSIA